MRLTVCITHYGRWTQCRAALESVLCQDLPGIEVVLVDDCSPGPVPREIHEIVAQHGVRFVRQEKNLGLAAARNAAIDIASSELFSFCDDDDQWPMDMARRLVSGVPDREDQPAMAIGLNGRYFGSFLRRFSAEPRLRDVMVGGLTPPVGAQIYATAVLRACGGYNVDVRSGVDHDLWVRLAETNPVVGVAWGATPNVSKRTDESRMTTREAERRARIAASLELWEGDLCRVFGSPFADHFKRCYLEYLDHRFLRLAIARREFLHGLLLLLRRGVLARQIADLARRLFRVPRLCKFRRFRGPLGGLSR